MKWRDKDLTHREDWAAAMRSLLTPEDAREFIAAAESYEPKHWRELLGYLTAELPPPEDARVRELLGVVHPINPTNQPLTEVQMFLIGYMVGQNGAPEWMQAVDNIPRRECHPYFPRTKETPSSDPFET